MAEFNEVKTPDMDEPWDGAGWPPGVKVALLALCGALAVLVVPYVVTPLLPEDSEAHAEVGEYRVWISDDPLPFSKLFRTSRPKTEEVAAEVLGAAEGTLAAVGADGEPEVPAAPVLVVDPGVAAPGEPPIPSEPSVPGEPGAPVTPPAPSEPARPESPLARIHIPATTWEGLSVFIEDPKGALRPFFDRLAKVALKQPGAIVRISHFGDSAIAADGMPSAARRLLQRTFGDGGHGYSLAAASNNWYRRKDIEWTSKGFQTEVFISDDAPDGRYGFAGTAAIGYQGAKATWKTVTGPEGTVGTAASRFAVPYLAQKGGGRFALVVDGVERLVVDTASDEKEDRVAEVAVPDGPHTFELRNVGGGKTKVYGAVIERDSGVVYDGLGTIGARDTRWINVDKDHMRWAFAARRPDLGVFMYGGNQLEDKLSMESYRAALTEIVTRWRAALGDASCLMMSPIDHGERRRGRVRTVERQIEIMKVQREVALEQGCAWYSLYDAMGGDGSIGKWHEAGLAEGDLAHPTAKGAVVLGQLFFKALMKGFSDHVAAAVAAEAAP